MDITASEATEQKQVRIFFCYARKDELLLNQLKNHLQPLQRQGLIKLWYDREIRAGSEWESVIKKQLDMAQIILLLVSPDFMASDYCYSIEMERALARHKAGKAQVIPIILRPVFWKDAPFGKLRVLPTDTKPVTSWPNRDEAFLDIATGIRKIVQELLKPSSPAISQKTRGEWLHTGDISFDHGDYEEALKAYEQALHLDPNDARAYNGKGNALYNLKLYNEALAAYEQAVRLAPNHARSFYGKGTALYSLKNYHEALAAYEQAIRLDPKYASPHNGKGNALYNLKRYEEALAAHEEAIRLDPNEANYRTNKGNDLQDLKRYNEALAAYEQAVRLDPNYARAYNGKGNALYSLKRFDEALVAYEQTIHLVPNYARAYNGKGNVLRDLRQYEEALAAYEQAIRLAPDYAAAY